jgi:hypothetical protein
MVEFWTVVRGGKGHLVASQGFSGLGKWSERNITGEYSNEVGGNKRWLGGLNIE